MIAEETGLFEGLLEPGSRRAAPATRSAGSGSPTGPSVRRVTLPAPLDGVLAVIRAIPVTEAGDSVFVTGQPIAAADLL